MTQQWQSVFQPLESELERRRRELQETRLERLRPRYEQRLRIQAQRLGIPWSQLTAQPQRPAPAIRPQAPVAPEGSWWEKALGWYQEKVITPISAMVTAPWSPAIEGTEGMGWLETQIAEYKEWEAPKYVKGAVEFFTDPLILLGGFGIGASVASKLGILGVRGLKAIKPILQVEQFLLKGITSPIELPIRMLSQKGIRPGLEAWKTAFGKAIREPVAARPRQVSHKQALADLDEVVIQRPGFGTRVEALLSPDNYRRTANLLAKIPGGRTIVRAIGGEAGLLGTAVTKELQDAGVGTLIRLNTIEEGRNMAKAFRELLNARGTSTKLLGADAQTGICKFVRAKPEFPNISLHLRDVAQAPDKYIFMQEGAYEYIKSYHKLVDKAKDFMVKYNAILPKNKQIKLLTFAEAEHYVHLEVMGIMKEGKFIPVRPPSGRVGAKLPPFRHRQLMEAWADMRTVYSPDLAQSLERYVNYTYRTVADIEMSTIINKLGQLPIERVAPEILERAGVTATQAKNAKYIQALVNRALRGEVLPQASLQAAERAMPDLGARLRAAMGKKTVLRQIHKEALAISKEVLPEAQKAAWARKAAITKAREWHIGEAVIAHPAFGNRIFPEEIAEAITKVLNVTPAHPIFKVPEQASGIMRLLVATADFSGAMIQGLPVLGRDPATWIKMVGKQFEWLVKPANFSKWLAKPENMQSALDRIAHGGYSGTFEFFEALPQLVGEAGVIGGRIGRVGRFAMRETYGRFNVSFSGAGEFARTELWKALRATAKNENELAELARVIDRMTGVMSTEVLGIGPTQRAIEGGWGFFSPRYTRAGLSYLGDCLKGGLTGVEARKGLGSLMASGAYLYYATAKAMGQEPNFDPRSARFMTIQIGDDHVGVGSIWTSLARFAANVATTARDEPLDLVAMDRWDNPFIRFLFSRSAPLTGLTVGLAIEQADYFGEPFETPADWVRFLADQVVPIALQTVTTQEDRAGPAAFIAEEMGMRTFPVSAWEERNELRERYAEQDFSLQYSQLNEFQRVQLRENHDDLREKFEEAQADAANMSEPEWIEWRSQWDTARQTYQDRLWELQKAYDDGVIIGRQFREEVQTAGAVLRESYDLIEQNPRYAPIYEYFNIRQDPEAHDVDTAYNQYMTLMYGSDIEDEYGNYDFREADERLRYFKIQWGEAVYQYVQQRLQQGRNLPPMMIEYNRAKEILRPYWEVQERLEQHARRSGWTYDRYERELQRLRESMRNANPEMRRYLELFYSW